MKLSEVSISLVIHITIFIIMIITVYTLGYFSPVAEAALPPRSNIAADRAFDTTRYMKCLEWAEEVVGNRYPVKYTNGNSGYRLYNSDDFGIIVSKLAMDRYKIEMGIACGSE